MARHYKELKVWQKAVEFAVIIYRVTDSFPKSEQYGLVNQLRRSGVSVASNIAEGSERQSDKDFVRFLNISKGSLAEFETQMTIARELGYLTQQDYVRLCSKGAEIGKMLNGLTNKLLETGDLRLETADA